MADHIWSQGMENKDLICSNTKSRFFYYPNCVSEEFMPHQCPIKEKNTTIGLYGSNKSLQKR